MATAANPTWTGEEDATLLANHKNNHVLNKNIPSKTLLQSCQRLVDITWTEEQELQLLRNANSGRDLRFSDLLRDKSLKECQRRLQRFFTNNDDEALIETMMTYPTHVDYPWVQIVSDTFPDGSQTAKQCKDRWRILSRRMIMKYWR